MVHAHHGAAGAGLAHFASNQQFQWANVLQQEWPSQT
jgi:hypothetical protein